MPKIAEIIPFPTNKGVLRDFVLAVPLPFYCHLKLVEERASLVHFQDQKALPFPDVRLRP